MLDPTENPASQATGFGAAAAVVLNSEQVIATGLCGGKVSLRRVARLQGLSERTLQRRLEQSDRSFVELVVNVRRNNATYYLRHSSLSIVEIALRLGYSDQSAFTRAFKRWTSLTPGAFRRSAV